MPLDPATPLSDLAEPGKPIEFELIHRYSARVGASETQIGSLLENQLTPTQRKVSNDVELAFGNNHSVIY